MYTSDRVAAYRAELASNKPLSKFSPGAFVFNSVYFLYYGCPWFFLLFCLLPWAVAALFIIQGASGLGLITGLLVSRIAAGFFAPRILKRHKEHFVAEYADANSYAPVEFFSVSLLRLSFLMLLSFGLYGIYWSYKNWVAIKRDTKDEIYPIAEGWFFWIFYIIPLFKRIKQNMNRAGMNGNIMLYGWLWLLLTIINSIAFNDVWTRIFPEGALWLYLIGLVTYLGSLVMVIPAQKMINAYNLKNNPQTAVRKGVLPGEVITTIIGLLMFVGGTMRGTQPTTVEEKLASLPPQEQHAVGFFVGNYLRNIVVYNNYCTAQGYPLQKYEDAYLSVYQPQFDVLSRKLDSLNTNFAEVEQYILTLMPADYLSNNHDVASDMEEIAQIIGQPMTMKEVCQWLDENAEQFLHGRQDLKDALNQSAEILQMK